MRNDFESNYLMHHGILGQKWGRRNGPPYPLDASGHSASEKKAGWRQSLDDSYKKSMQKKADRRQSEADKYAEKHGKRSNILDSKAAIAKKEAESVNSTKKAPIEKKTSDEKKHLTDDQKRMIRNGALVAGFALVAVGGVYLYKKKALNPLHVNTIRIGKEVDISKLSTTVKTISKNTKLQRISSSSVEDYINQGKSFYASYLKKDNAIYKEQMPKFIESWYRKGIVNDKQAYVSSLKLKRDIRIASEREVAKAYMKANNVNKVDEGRMTQFIENLVNRDSDINKTFISELKSKGFDGIIDTNDSNSSFTKSPLFLFDASEIIDSMKTRKLGKVERFISVITS